jgi:hypothetical protein
VIDLQYWVDRWIGNVGNKPVLLPICLPVWEGLMSVFLNLDFQPLTLSFAKPKLKITSVTKTKDVSLFDT